MQNYQRIKDLRTDKEITQKEMSEILHMQPTQYRRYENGESEIPLNLAITLAKFYNVSIDYIAGMTNDKKGLNKSTLKEDEKELIENFNRLTEREKGEIEYHVRQILEQHTSESEVG